MLCLAGVLIAALSALLLAYSLWPLGSVLEHFEPPPTLFIPPEALGALWRLA
jgi:hypothetical protein